MESLLRGRKLDLVEGVLHILLMITMDKNPPTATSSKKPLKPSAYLVFSILLLLMIVLWRDRSQLKVEYAEQTARNEQLNNTLSELKTELVTAQEIIDFLKSSNAKTTKKNNDMGTLATPLGETEILVLQDPVVTVADIGLTVRFEFELISNSELPKTITLVVRMPANSESKILSLKPISNEDYATVMHVVNASGDLGMIEGSPSNRSALIYELTVSEPVKATVRGSEGIKDFELDITADGCTTRKL